MESKTTPDGPESALEMIMDSVLKFKYKGHSKDALKELHSTFTYYEDQLNKIGKIQAFSLIEEILINQFEDQFPKVLGNIKFVLDKLFDEELASLELKKGSTPGQGMVVPKEMEMEIIVDAFKRKVGQNFSAPLPNIVTMQYINCLKEIIKCYFDNEPNPGIEMSETEFEDLCNDFIKRVTMGITKPFDENEIKIAEVVRRELYLGIFNGVAFNRTKFCPDENIELIRILHDFQALIPCSEITSNEINKVFGKIINPIKRSERKQISKFALMMLSTAISQIGRASCRERVSSPV